MPSSMIIARVLLRPMHYSIYHPVCDLCELIPAWLISPDCSDGLATCQTAPALKGLHFYIRSPKTLGGGVHRLWAHQNLRGALSLHRGSVSNAESPPCVCTGSNAEHGNDGGQVPARPGATLGCNVTFSVCVDVVMWS